MTSEASEARPTDWAAVRQAYVSNDLAVREICRQYGIHSQALYRRARNEGWPRRRGQHRTNAGSLELLARLRRIAEAQIVELEARRTSKRGTSKSNGPERDARVLNELVKLIERMVAIEAKHQVRHDGAFGWSPAERARRRTDLANKLIAMLEQERGAPLPDECA